MGGATYEVKATGGVSGKPVHFPFRDEHGLHRVGSTVSFIAHGTCSVDANQTGNAKYNTAPQATQTFAVG